MAATLEQKRRQQAAMRRAVQVIRAEHPDLWADAYQRARMNEEPAICLTCDGSGYSPDNHGYGEPAGCEDCAASGFKRPR